MAWEGSDKEYENRAFGFLHESLLSTLGRFSSIASFNDSRYTSHADVLEVFDLAIEKAAAAV